MKNGSSSDLGKVTRDFIFASVVLFAIQPVYAHAYVDPGSGSVIVTAILGFFAAIGYTMRKQFYKIKNLFKRNNTDD